MKIIEKAEKLIELIDVEQANLLSLKRDLVDAEEVCELKQAEIQLMDKDAWKEVNCSNVEQRKAHITLETKELSKKVSEIKNEILETELKIKTLNRKLRLAMTELELSK